MSDPHLSLAFYDYLCDIIGTEDVVNTRRRIFTAFDHEYNFYTPFDDVYGNGNNTCITSGSKAEGLDLNCSDLDLMCLLNYYPVYESKDDSVTQLGSVPFILDTTDCKPGFTQLKRFKNISNEQVGEYCENKAGESYFSSRLLTDTLAKENPTDIIHGPCISETDGTFDMAVCLRCEKWISQAQPWIVRSRQSAASYKINNTILQFGVLFVPIGCKNSPNKDLEWRISFSYAEKLLIWSFNHVQLLCYALLKILFKDIIKKETGDLLCSYFLKTVMLWICEETKPSQWKANNTMSCFMDCLNRLIYCVKYKTCVHYFIPENDLFAERFDKQQHSLLLCTLNQLQSLGWTCLLHTKTLNSFGGFLTQDQSLLLHKVSYLPSLLIIRRLIDEDYVQQLENIVQICMRSNTKDFLIYSISVINTYKGERLLKEEKSLGSHGNKQLYKIYRKSLCHLVIGLNCDAVSGWLILASFFYVNKQYQKCKDILSDCLSRCTPDKIFLTQVISNEAQTRFNNMQREFGLRHLSLIKKYIINCVEFSSSSQIIPGEMSVLDDDDNNIIVPPVVYDLFLTFLCDHHLGNQRQKNESLGALEIVIQNKYYIDDNDDLETVNTLLSIAYSLRDD